LGGLEVGQALVALSFPESVRVTSLALPRRSEKFFQGID